jgi:hypothetical protein
VAVLTNAKYNTYSSDPSPPSTDKFNNLNCRALGQFETDRLKQEVKVERAKVNNMEDENGQLLKQKRRLEQEKVRDHLALRSVVS